MDAVTFALLKKKLETKASLVDGKVPAEELPSYVDDVVEYEDLAHFPEEGERSKIYVALDTGCTYRWSGSEYVQIGGQDLSDYYTKEETQAALSGKQDTIEDLSSIRSGANAGATAVQPEDLTPATGADIKEKWIPFIMKGDIISMNLDGTTRNYRILSVDGAVAKVVAMFFSSASQKFNASSKTVTFSDGTIAQQYMGSDLDTYLNETWYNTLNTNAKAAIVEVNLTQDLWIEGGTGNPVFYRTNYNGDKLPFSRMTGTSPIGSRKVYALSVQDVIDYLELSSGDDMTWQSVIKMFYNDEQQGTRGYPWFSSASSNYLNSAYMLYSTQGYISVFYDNCDRSYHVCPAFAIDLSKIDFTFGGN